MCIISLLQHQQQGEDASTILGDKLQQKMDAITFTQERMKRQLDDLQDKTQVCKIKYFSQIKVGKCVKDFQMEC